MISTDTWRAHGRQLVKGTEVAIQGQRGRFRFLRHCTSDSGQEWVDVIDPRGHWRSFRPERIRTVHNRRKLK